MMHAAARFPLRPQLSTGFADTAVSHSRARKQTRHDRVIDDSVTDRGLSAVW
jgi:hypothetical protein